MEIIAFILVLAAIFAVKSVAILRCQDEEIAKSVAFSWTKPVEKEEPVVVAETPIVRERVSWTPTYAATRVRAA
jgi:hypothetical protein